MLVIVFNFLDSLRVKERVCVCVCVCVKECIYVCNLMNGSFVLVTSLLCPNPRNKNEKEKPHFLEKF